MIQSILAGLAASVAKQVVVDRLRKRGIDLSHDEQEEVAEAADVGVRKAIKAQPKVENEINAEPWYQSGVAWFGTGGVLWSAGNLIAIFGEHGLSVSAYDKADWSVIQVAAPALLMGVGVLVRRFKKGLKPITLFGLLR